MKPVAPEDVRVLLRRALRFFASDANTVIAKVFIATLAVAIAMMKLTDAAVSALLHR